MQKICRAYVEVTNNNNGNLGWCYQEVDGCTDDNCLKALNKAEHCASFYAECDGNSDCEVTYWRYECIDAPLHEDESETSQAFKSLPKVHFGKAVPK